MNDRRGEPASDPRDLPPAAPSPGAAEEAAPGGGWRRLVVLGVLVAGVAAFFALGGGRWLSVDALQEHRGALLAFRDRNYGLALAAAVAIYALSTALSIPGGLVLTLAIGYLFGRWVGTAAVVVGATTGATVVFLAARYLVSDWARRRMGARATRVAEGFGQDAFSYLLFLRLVPLFPFWLVNLVPALAPVRVRTYVAATALGIVPGTFVYANLGTSLGGIRSSRDLVSGQTLLAFALLGLLSLVPALVRKLRKPGPATAA